MTTEQDQELRNILCEVPEIKEDLMELRFGTHISWRDKKTMLWNDDTVGIVYPLWVFTKNGANVKKSNIDEIIGNPIEERHIRWYCEEKGYNFTMNTEGDIALLDFNSKPLRSIITKIDNKKPLQNQDPKVIESIINFLKT